MSLSSKEAPMICYPHYVEHKKRQLVTVVYGEGMPGERGGLFLEIVESSSGDIVDRVPGVWNGDRVFTFTTPALETFGYYDITPVVTGGRRERKLVSFSICCSSSWELYQQMNKLSSPQATLPICLILCALCEGNPLMADPYWDVVSQYAVDSILSSPANRMKLGLTDTHIGSVCIKDMFAHLFQNLTLEEFFRKHNLTKAKSSLVSVPMETADEDDHDYEELDELRNEMSQRTLASSVNSLHISGVVPQSIDDIYDDTSDLLVATPIPTQRSDHFSGSGQFRRQDQSSGSGQFRRQDQSSGSGQFRRQDQSSGSGQFRRQDQSSGSGQFRRQDQSSGSGQFRRQDQSSGSGQFGGHGQSKGNNQLNGSSGSGQFSGCGQSNGRDQYSRSDQSSGSGQLGRSGPTSGSSDKGYIKLTKAPVGALDVKSFEKKLPVMRNPITAQPPPPPPPKSSKHPPQQPASGPDEEYLPFDFSQPVKKFHGNVSDSALITSKSGSAMKGCPRTNSFSGPPPPPPPAWAKPTSRGPDTLPRPKKVVQPHTTQNLKSQTLRSYSKRRDVM
jgi:hypothetical protein